MPPGNRADLIQMNLEAIVCALFTRKCYPERISRVMMDRQWMIRAGALAVNACA